MCSSDLGELLIGDDGKIAAIGKTVDAPADAKVIDATGCLVTPGFIDAHCHIGIDEEGMRWEGNDCNEYSSPVTPEMRSIDGINPRDEAFHLALEGGVTTATTGPGSANVLGGTFVALKLDGNCIDDMIVKYPVAMKIAFGENPKGCYGQNGHKEPVNAIYRNIKQNRIRKRIAKRFGLPINVFESWLTVIAVTRNACGHHSRVWNKQNAIQPAIPNSPAGEWITLPTDSMRAYFDLCIIKYFLNVISPNNDMQSNLTWLFIRFPEIDLKALGFPQGWETEPLWR